MFDSSVQVYTNDYVAPIYPGGKMLPVNLAPNTHFDAGRIIGQVTGSANEVQTIAIGGAPTGGYLVIRTHDPYGGGSGVFQLPYNATAAIAQGLINAVAGPYYVVTGGPLPGTPLVFTASGVFANMPIPLMSLESPATMFLTGGAPTATITKTTAGRSKATFAPYLSGNADGSQVAKMVMQYEVTTDSGGNIVKGPAAIEASPGFFYPECPAWYVGEFRTSQLRGFDQAALTAGFGRLVSGTVADGILVLGGA